MDILYVTVEDGKAVINSSEVDGCLTTVASIANVIKPMSTKELSEFYKSLTHKEVKRFASKGDAAIRIHKFIAPTGNGKKSGPKVLPSRKAKKKVADKVKPAKEKKAGTKRIDVNTLTIHVLDHEKKTFQEGSVRGVCYQLIMDNATKKDLEGYDERRKQMSVESYLGLTADSGITDAVALACIKKLAIANQKVQTVELV